MKILCLVKFTPNVDEFEYDPEKHVLIRDKGKQVLNPDDACALGFAVQLKKKHPEVEIEIVSMAPMSAVPLMEDLLRRRLERGTLLSDPRFAGSDTLATGRILGAYLKQADYDVILTGDRSVDGDTAQIPSELAELLGLPQVSAIVKMDEASFLEGKARVEVDNDHFVDTYEVQFPAILSVTRASRIRLPFARFADMKMDVSDRLRILNAADFGFAPDEIGSEGSPTRVCTTWVREYEEKQEQILVRNDAEGVETVYRFLKEQGYLP